MRTLFRRWVDIGTGNIALFASVSTVILVIVFALMLFLKAYPIFMENSLGNLIFSSKWAPMKGSFGFFDFILGTLWVTALSMIIATPLSILTALYLVEYAPKWVKIVMDPAIDLLAGIPSVVYGVWGVVVIVPFVRELGDRLGYTSTGYSVLSGGIVLALMIVPIMTSVMQEVLRSTPLGLREVSLSVGATKWETTRYIVCRHALGGVIAAGIMGLSRAFGETIAVLMVVGNQVIMPRSLFDPGYPIPALIANNYGEMMSIRLYDAAIMTAALILMGVVFITQLAARLVVRRMMYGREAP